MSKWKPIETAPKDGREVIVGVDVATAWIVRSAAYSDGEHWQMVGAKSREDDRGWWSYENSVSQEKLDGIYEPTHWLCDTDPPGR